MENIISNVPIDNQKLQTASRIIKELQQDINICTDKGCGPFVAAIYDENNNLIAKAANSVVNYNNSNAHAEMLAIKIAEERLGTYDLSKYNLKLYVTSEPCIMCLGGIMWSGIKELYYGVPSKLVEEITGFDEGFKHDWIEEFKKRGIAVYGNIESALGAKQLKDYITGGGKIYKPLR